MATLAQLQQQKLNIQGEISALEIKLSGYAGRPEVTLFDGTGKTASSGTWARQAPSWPESTWRNAWTIPFTKEGQTSLKLSIVLHENANGGNRVTAARLKIGSITSPHVTKEVHGEGSWHWRLETTANIASLRDGPQTIYIQWIAIQSGDTGGGVQVTDPKITYPTSAIVSKLNSQLSPLRTQIAKLDNQITAALVEESLKDQYNILRAETDKQIVAIRAEAEAIIAEIRIDYAQRDENVRAEADAKIQAARAEADAKIQAVRDEKARQLVSLVNQINQAFDPTGESQKITIQAIEAMTTEEIEALTVKYSALIANYKADADKKIVDYKAQTDAEIAKIKADADAEIERVKAEAEAQMETLRREAGVVPTIAPELAKYLPLLLVGGYLAVTKKPEKELAAKK